MLFNDLVVITPYSVYIKTLLLIITILYIITKNEYMKLNLSPYSLNYSDYIILILINVLGMCLFIESYNLILIYIAIELQSYSVYIITSRYNNSYYASKSGLIYFLLGSLASIIILIGLVILYSITGLTNIYDISTYISTNDIQSNKLLLGYMLIFIGLLFKIGVAPFHN
jgi:NADH:ubiquinone oxidoreductase subunit 2 (subunit N)